MAEHRLKPIVRRLARRLLPFGWGNISKLALAYFFSTLYFYAPVGTLYLQGRGLSLMQINSIWSIIVATMFLSEIPTGLLADRIGHKWAIVLALALQALGEVIYLFAQAYWIFVLDAIVAGVGFAFGSGCVAALVHDSLQSSGREGEMSEALGVIEAAQRFANLLAYSVGGLLVAQLTQRRFTLAIAVTASAVIVGCIVALTLEEPRVPREPGHRESSWRLLSDGWNMLRHNRQFRHLVLLGLGTMPLINYLSSLYQPHFVRAQVQPWLFGIALALASGLSVLGARYAYWLEARLGARPALFLATLLPGALYLLMALVLHPIYSVAVFCLLYSSMSLRGPLLTAHLNSHIEDKNRATVFSLISMFSGLYVAAIGPLVGYLGDLSTTTALAVMGSIVLLGGLLFRLR